MTTTVAPAPPVARARRGPAEIARGVSRVLGELLITVGVVVLLFAVYDLYGTGLYTAGQQRTLAAELQQEWAAPEPVPPGQGEGAVAPAEPGAPVEPVEPVRVEPVIGDGVAIVRIPRLGRDYAQVVVEGVDRESLKKGPGHYPGTAFPGEIGNLVLSGHRTTYGAPFGDLDRLERGDAVVVETREGWFTYTVTTEDIVTPDRVDVTFPVPGRAGEEPTEAILTLVTCNPKYSARERLVLHGDLVESRLRADGPPDVLAG